MWIERDVHSHIVRLRSPDCPIPHLGVGSSVQPSPHPSSPLLPDAAGIRRYRVTPTRQMAGRAVLSAMSTATVTSQAAAVSEDWQNLDEDAFSILSMSDSEDMEPVIISRPQSPFLPLRPAPRESGTKERLLDRSKRPVDILPCPTPDESDFSPQGTKTATSFTPPEDINTSSTFERTELSQPIPETVVDGVSPKKFIIKRSCLVTTIDSNFQALVPEHNLATPLKLAPILPQLEAPTPFPQTTSMSEFFTAMNNLNSELSAVLSYLDRCEQSTQIAVVCERLNDVQQAIGSKLDVKNRTWDGKLNIDVSVIKRCTAKFSQARGTPSASLSNYGDLDDVSSHRGNGYGSLEEQLVVFDMTADDLYEIFFF